MRKFFIAALMIAASFSLTFAQGQQGNSQDDQIPNMGQAPKEENGIGRLDLRVEDENGNPIYSAFVKLESNRSDGYFCESWNWTNDKGVAVLPPIHMGKLTVTVKGKGYQTLKMQLSLAQLAEPVHVTLHKK